jgi:hypothetical protein
VSTILIYAITGAAFWAALVVAGLALATAAQRADRLSRHAINKGRGEAGWTPPSA